MEFTEAIRSVLGKYATFSGRARRSEYWFWVLFVFLLSIATQVIDGFLVAPALGLMPFQGAAGQPLSMLTNLILLIPNLAVAVRRLHDVDRSGWWLLIILVPILGVIVLIYWFVTRGTVGPNTYGADPVTEVDARI